MHTDSAQADPAKLLQLASWYREFAKRAGDPGIWAARLRAAKELEAEAELAERIQTRRSRRREG
jgi:hypothetical protein